MQVITSQSYPGVISWGLRCLTLNAPFISPWIPEIIPHGLGHSTIDVQHFVLNIPFSVFYVWQLVINVLRFWCFGNQRSSLNVRCLTTNDQCWKSLYHNMPKYFELPKLSRLQESWTHHQPHWPGRHKLETDMRRAPRVTCVLTRGWHMSCFNRHKGYVNKPYLGDTWHLSYRSMSPEMMLVSHVSPRHTIFSLFSNLMVDIFPHRSIDPKFPLLHGYGIQSLPNPHITNPWKSQVFELSNIAPHVLYLWMVEIHFAICDFVNFHTLKTLGQVPMEYQVSGL